MRRSRKKAKMTVSRLDFGGAAFVFFENQTLREQLRTAK
jgi:hypothetical protein